MGTHRKPRTNVPMPQAVYDLVNEYAAALDMPTTTYICRVVLGAVKGGSANRLALIKDEFGLPTTRPAPPGVEWVPDENITFGSNAPKAARWLSENGYVLERHGPIGGNRNSRVAQGWTLTAPDGTTYQLEERRRLKAVREAEAIMRRRDAETREDAPCSGCG